MFAARNGHNMCMDRLIQAGAYVNGYDNKGCSVLCYAVMSMNVVCIDMLRYEGADVKAIHRTYDTDSTAMFKAALLGHDKYLQLLIEEGADVKARIMKDGVRYHAVTPGNKIELFAAAYFRKALNTVKVLLAFGAYVNIRIKSGLNALEIALSTTCRESENVIKLLHATGETTDDAAFFEFEINATTFRRKIDLPDYLLERHSNFTLKDMCREAIRKHLLDINPHLNLFVRIPQLGLPTRLCVIICCMMRI